MSFALLLAMANPGLPEILAAILALTGAAMLADGGPGMVAAETDSAEVMLIVHGWA
jgi:hypothetical protein